MGEVQAAKSGGRGLVWAMVEMENGARRWCLGVAEATGMMGTSVLREIRAEIVETPGRVYVNARVAARLSTLLYAEFADVPAAKKGAMGMVFEKSEGGLVWVEEVSDE